MAKFIANTVQYEEIRAKMMTAIHVSILYESQWYTLFTLSWV